MMPRPKRACWGGGLLLAALLTGCAGTLPPPPPPPAATEIGEDVAYLADPARQGRQLGSRGRDSAAAWIARRFQAAGLRPAFPGRCGRRDPCPPGGWGDAFVLPSWSIGGTGVNVGGVVEGEDPRLRGRVVVVGAHYDHIGRLAQYSRDPMTSGIRPGADDNASGTAALLELARRVSERPLPVTVLFVAFDAEELGLFGSRHLLVDPPVPSDSIVAMLNFDMVGRMRRGRLTVHNVGSAPWWREALQAANQDGLRLDLEHGGGASDHVAFREAGIPALHFYTGTHADYHRRGDRVERINHLGILRVVDLAERLLRRIPGAGPQAAPALPTAVLDFAERLRADVAKDSVGSMAAVVVAGPRILWAGAFGAVAGDGGAPAAPTTAYRVGSLTKVVTALTLVRLARRGVLSLEDPVATYVPEIAALPGVPTTWPAMTLEHLASHTAGLAREPSWPGAGRGPRSDWRRRTLESLPHTAVAGPPGAAYRYSNIGYAILGLAMERAAGRAFEELVAAEVLEPLGMRSTGFSPPPRGRARLAAGYVNLADGTVDPRVPRAEHRGRGYRVPGEGLYSTATDMARLAMALAGSLGEVYLDDDGRSTLFADRTPAGEGRSGYGLGLQRTRIAGRVLVGHSGTVPGYASYLAVDPESGTGVVILRSYNRGETNLGAAAQRLLLALGDGT